MDLIFAPYGIPTPICEYKFHPKRRFKFDFAWPDKMVAVEQEGGLWMRGGSGHSHPMWILRDMEKGNFASLLGWRVFRFTPQQLRKGEAQAFIKEVFDQVGEAA